MLRNFTGSLFGLPFFFGGSVVRCKSLTL
jgi:hypothetical protein